MCAIGHVWHRTFNMPLIFKATLGAALGAAGPVLEDLANFTNVTPEMLIGEVIG